jgi:ubiquinone/menaquinone biosynthesis C-methylase UbiE
MTGVKLGERFAQIGCADGGRLAAVASKVGLSGSARAIVPDETSALRARKGAAHAGVLIDVETAPPTRLPLEDAGCDLVVVDDTGSLLESMEANDRLATLRETARILRPGGRVMVIGRTARGGFGAMLSRRPTTTLDPIPSLQVSGFKSVRRLAERDGLVFVEGIKPRAT